MSVLTEISITSTGPITADIQAKVRQPTGAPCCEIADLINYLSKIQS